MADQPESAAEFQIRLFVHSKDAADFLCPDLVREAVGAGLDALEIQPRLEEEIDYTLEVRRVHI